MNKETVKIAYCGVYQNEQWFGALSEITYKLFNYLGIKKDQLCDIRIPTKCTRLIIPERSFVPFVYITPNYLSIYHCISKRIIEQKNLNIIDNSIRYDKVYFTRTALKKKTEIGEKIIEFFFKQNGFEILTPEKLTLEQQVIIIGKCRILASVEGTLAHNILWINDIQEQIIIRKQSKIMPRQFQFNEVTNIGATYIDAYVEPFKNFPISHDDGPFLLCFGKGLKEYATDNKMVVPSFSTQYYYMCFLIYTFKCVWFSVKPSIKRVLNKIL